MTNETYQWEIDLIRDRYHYLHLTYEQAEKVYQYENEGQAYSENHFFSQWEGEDYQLWIFEHILSEEQLVEYKRRSEDSIKQRPGSMAETDSQYIHQISYYQELFVLYEMHFWQPFFKDPFIFRSMGLFYENKITYLKAVYKSFLNDKRKEILTQHFRHYRNYAPHQLNSALVQNRLSYILPDTGYFRKSLDAPTLAMADYLVSKLKQTPEAVESFMLNSFATIKPLAEELMKKHFPDYPQGWHVINSTSTDEEQKEGRLLLWLLMDRDKYGLEALYPY